MSFAENNNGFTPSFVSLALSGDTHRFILVLECESRQYEGEVAVSHPRFCVGGPRATLDPRNVSINDLLPLGSSKVDLPQGWEKVHQLLYVVQASTDEHGWQYRSAWPSHALEAGDENWSNNNASNSDVRRRLWMTTVVKRDDVLNAKRKISELILSRQRGVILSGPLLRLEEDENGEKKWVSRKCALLDEKIQIMDEETGEEIDQLHVLGHQIKMLDGFAFSVRKLDGSSCVLFDTDSKETRRRWLIAISYQIAVRGSLIDFAPFPYAPPLGEDVGNRIILCGDLLKKGQTGMNWKSRYFKLTPRELQYFDRETLKGSIKIDGATVKSDERSLEITLRSKSGVTVIVKCDCMVNKVIWFGAFDSQIEVLASKIASAARAITAEERALSINQIGDEDAVTLNVVIPSVAVKEAEMSATANVTALGLGESHPLTSLFNHLKGEAISPTHVAPPSYEELPQTPRTATRMLLNSFVSSPNLITAMEAQQAAGEETPVDEEVEGEEAVEFITEEEDVSEEDDQNQEEVTEEMMEEAHEENGGEEAGPESETTDIDGATPVETDSSEGTIARRAAFKAYRPASAKFGCHPEQIVCLADFGVAPELLTTAQKVAILESAAYQYRSNQLAMQARVSRRSFTAVSPMKNSSSSDGYTPTGLRLQDADSLETHIENDGGAVAKTGDTLKNKIHNWEAWSSKDKASPVPKR